MKRSRPAEGDKRELARIDALLDRDDAQSIDHVVVRELDDRVRRLLALCGSSSRRVGR